MLTYFARSSPGWKSPGLRPGRKDADLSGEMALSANILACSLGQLRRVGNGCMSARFCMNRARPVTSFASDTGFFKRRIGVPVHRSRDRPRPTRMATPTLTCHGAGHVKVGIVLVTRRKVPARFGDRKSTRLNSSHRTISYAVFCLKKKTQHTTFKHHKYII